MKKFNLAVLIICIALACAGIMNPIVFMERNKPFYIVGIVFNAVAIVISIVCTVLHILYYRKHGEESQRIWTVALFAVTLCGVYYMMGQFLFVFNKV